MKGHKIWCTALTTAFVIGFIGGVCEVEAAEIEPILEYTEAAEAEPATENEAQTLPASTEQQNETGSITEEELAAYYNESVFIGDSIMQGFRNYSSKSENFVHGINFLSATSYSAGNALKPVTGKSVHPMYKGKKYQVWNVVPMVGSKRAFILLGMNDLIVTGLEDSKNNYKELINKIVETSPDIEIHIISVTYTLKDSKVKGALCNSNIDIYNSMLQEMAAENGWGYIDLCTPISDGAGNLKSEYCSDGYVHLTRTAYSVWEDELIQYAEKQLSK